MKSNPAKKSLILVISLMLSFVWAVCFAASAKQEMQVEKPKPVLRLGVLG